MNLRDVADEVRVVGQDDRSALTMFPDPVEFRHAGAVGAVDPVEISVGE